MVETFMFVVRAIAGCKLRSVRADRASLGHFLLVWDCAGKMGLPAPSRGGMFRNVSERMPQEVYGDGSIPVRSCQTLLIEREVGTGALLCG